MHTIFCTNFTHVFLAHKKTCVKFAVKGNLILKKKSVLITILLVLLVTKLNALFKFKKRAKMLTMTTFKINTNIRLFLMKQPSEKIF